MWECGLKQKMADGERLDGGVTPYVGVWIETYVLNRISRWFWVTPYVGVWIETNVNEYTWKLIVVTPYVGVWIETVVLSHSTEGQRHSLCGSVDWNITKTEDSFRPACHSLCGSVDWNSLKAAQ